MQKIYCQPIIKLELKYQINTQNYVFVKEFTNNIKRIEKFFS